MNVDETLDSLNPQELAALEQEIDKVSADTQVAYYFQLGRKMAQESMDELKKTGRVSPALHLAKEALTPPNGRIREAFSAAAKGKGSWKQVKQVAREQVGKAADAEIARVIDKCSAEELEAVEKAIDMELAEAKVAEEYVETYFEIGRKMAREVYADLDKTAARAGAFGALGKAVMEFAKKKPMLTGAAMGVGGTILAQKILDR
jgi:hypothetical protein